MGRVPQQTKLGASAVHTDSPTEDISKVFHSNLDAYSEVTVSCVESVVVKRVELGDGAQVTQKICTACQ
jgi:hypothetical protein